MPGMPVITRFRHAPRLRLVIGVCVKSHAKATRHTPNPEYHVRSLLLLLALWLSTPAAFAATTPVNPAENVVRKHMEAVGNANLDALLGVLSRDVQVYSEPSAAHSLVGPLSDHAGSYEQMRSYFGEAFKKPTFPHGVVGMISLGELVLARVAIKPDDGTPADHALMAFRVRGGAIDRIWHIAKVDDADPGSGSDAQAITQQLQVAGNRGDAEGFVALFHDDARHFHPRRDPSILGGAPSLKVFDRPSRMQAHREMFANGPTAQVRITDSLALGEWVVDIEEFTFADGRKEDHLSMNRVRNGLIVDTWHLADKKR